MAPYYGKLRPYCGVMLWRCLTCLHNWHTCCIFETETGRRCPALIFYAMPRRKIFTLLTLNDGNDVVAVWTFRIGYSVHNLYKFVPGVAWTFQAPNPDDLRRLQIWKVTLRRTREGVQLYHVKQRGFWISSGVTNAEMIETLSRYLDRAPVKYEEFTQSLLNPGNDAQP